MFHREGYKIILITTIIFGISFIFLDKFVLNETWNRGISIIILLSYLFILHQFRNPKRKVITNEEAILSPVNGTLTTIETVNSSDVKQEFIKLTFKVSPLNYHIVRAPISGKVTKSNQVETISAEIQGNSQTNLKTSIYLESAFFSQNPVLYTTKNSDIKQGEEIGFINFDAKATMIIPKSLKLKVKINERVKAGEQIIATI